MKIGAIVPQGWVGEYDGWDPLDAWRRTTEVARQAERLGFESIWLFDHFHTVPRPTDEITFESFTSLSALAALTERVRLGHIVICTAFRNPALTAKMISTMDSISGGRMELGIGAGWKRDEWLAYGYGFPETQGAAGAARRRPRRHHGDARRRQAPARDLRGPLRARSATRINVPKPIQRPRVPIMVGGNGPNVTWRLAARHADELNLDGMDAGRGRRGTPRHRVTMRGGRPRPGHACRSRSTSGTRRSASPAPARVDRLAAYREAGVQPGDRASSAPRPRRDEALESLVEDARAAGVELA